MSDETHAKVDDLMMSEARREEIDRHALNVAFKSQFADEPLTSEEEMIVDLSRHLAGTDRKIENLSQKFRISQNTVDGLKDSVEGFLRMIEQSIVVAEAGTLVGEVVALKAIKSDFLEYMVGGRK